MRSGIVTGPSIDQMYLHVGAKFPGLHLAVLLARQRHKVEVKLLPQSGARQRR
jgi:hypothetical protein